MQLCSALGERRLARSTYTDRNDFDVRLVGDDATRVNTALASNAECGRLLQEVADAAFTVCRAGLNSLRVASRSCIC